MTTKTEIALAIEDTEKKEANPFGLALFRRRMKCVKRFFSVNVTMSVHEMPHTFNGCWLIQNPTALSL